MTDTSWFEFRVLLHMDWWPSQGERTSLPYYLPIATVRRDGFMPFPKGINAKWYANIQYQSSNLDKLEYNFWWIFLDPVNDGYFC